MRAHLGKAVAMLALVLLLTWGHVVPMSSAAHPDAEMIVVAGVLIDGTGAPPERDRAIIIRDGWIVDIVPASVVDVTSDRVVDARNYTVLPGIINAHVHTGYDARSWICAGVTTIYDLGTNIRHISAFSTTYARGVAPRLMQAGPIITSVGGYPMFDSNRHMRYEVASEEEARLIVNRLVSDYAVQIIKLAITDMLGRQPIERLSPDIARAAVETAHSYGLKVAVHVDEEKDVEIMLTTGADVLAHVTQAYMSDRLLAKLVKHDIAMIPTLTARVAFRWSRVTVDNVRRFHRLGGKIVLGNDFPAVYGEKMPIIEMRLLEFCGLSPLDIIVAGTRNAAEVMGHGEWLGTIEPGKVADVLILGSNPLDDLEAFRDIRYVIKDGKIVCTGQVEDQ